MNINKEDYKALRSWLKKTYGHETEIEITHRDKQITGYMYGNNECFDANEFYQFLLTEYSLYKTYYEIPEGCDDLGSLDYNNPYGLIDVNAHYYIDYVI